MSNDTLTLFAELLAQVQVPASAPDFEQIAARVATAKRELAEAINVTSAPEPWEQD